MSEQKEDDQKFPSPGPSPDDSHPMMPTRVHGEARSVGDESHPGSPRVAKGRYDSSHNTEGGLQGAYKIQMVSSRGGNITHNVSPLDHIRIRFKLFLLVMVMVLPAAALLVLLVNEKSIAIEFSSKERFGVDYARPAVRLLEAAAFHGWAGQTTTTEDLKAATAPHLRELAGVDQRNGMVMKVSAELDQLGKKFSLSASDPATTELVAESQEFIARINDVSNLILDPDLDSYYMMDATMLILPKHVPVVADIARNLLQLAPNSGQDPVTLSADIRAQLTQEIGAVRSALRTHARGFQVALDNNPSKTIGAGTMALSAKTVEQVESFLAKTEKIISSGQIASDDADHLRQLAVPAVSALSELWSHAFDQLDSLLALRIKGFMARKVQALVYVSAGLLASFLFAYYLSHRLGLRLSQLNNIANRIAVNAEIDLDVENDLEGLSSRDEIGDLAQALSVMTLKLRRSFDEIRNKSYELEHANQTLEGRVARRTAEIQAKSEQLEKALEQLEKTKDQLIVQEKMASLGSLTAGIAHEIKNPLNFVNNFAELSVEIAGEIREILDGIRSQISAKVVEDLEMCLDDLEQNVSKIHEHGKRADSIVKGMLQHSRGASGEFVRININNMLDEYVNLAYHGMRAQDSTFNVTIEKNFDRALPDIPVVPQDISRVFLNIVNNGCYAADLKKKTGQAPENFMPTISVFTQALGDQVEIRIRDNGTGMPESVRAKIFEPFFTTKPTGVGTGLGLSLSYDIVVQEHAGTLAVETKDGEYTEFIITLPMKREGVGV